MTSSTRSRLADSLELALKEGDERAFALTEKKEGSYVETFFSQSYACEKCGSTYPNLTPRHFSWNHPDGACQTCDGLGQVLSFREDLIIPDPEISLAKGAIKAWRLGSRKMVNLRKNILKSLSEQVELDLKLPWSQLPEEQKDFLLNGDPVTKFELKLQIGRGKAKKQPFPGILSDLAQTMKTTSSESLRARLLTYQIGKTCPECNGKRLSSFSRSVLLGGKSFDFFFLSHQLMLGILFLKVFLRTLSMKRLRMRSADWNSDSVF